jgi:hypothetical protein
LVGADVSELVPVDVRAVTMERMVWPTSALLRRYVLHLAPLIVEHL